MRSASPPVGVFSTQPRWPFSLPECHNLNLRGWLAEEWIASWLAVGGGGVRRGWIVWEGNWSSWQEINTVLRVAGVKLLGLTGGLCGVIGSGGAASRQPTPPPPLPPQTPPQYCHSCHMSSPYTAVTPGGRWSSLSPFPSHPCKCPLRRWMQQILDPFFMLLCKGKIYVIWEFHGNKVTIYWKLKEWNRLEEEKKGVGWLGSAY